VLAQPVVAWLGLISYGVFLWHYAVVLRLGGPGAGLDFWPLLAVTLAITVALASVSYYGLERPLLRLKYRAP
jgi:peptidoglycan/LPS O-acetylase OafA/YrhL